MKPSKKFGFTAMIIVIMTLSFTQSFAQQDDKLVKAENNFCNSLTTFANSLESLDKINENSTMDEFRKAYKNADKAWGKVQKTAAKLEKVEMKESVKAYNQLVDAVNNIDGDTKTSDATNEINKHVDATASQIDDIMTIVCKQDDK